MAKRRFNSVGAWCAQATGYIIHPADRKQVRQELEGHFEDRIDELKATGMNYQEALQLAEEAMGDADEVGRLLRRIHTPYLSWAVTLSKYICIAALLVFIFKGAIPFGLDALLYYREPYTVEERYAERLGWFDNDYTPIPIENTLWFEKAGYTFSVERADLHYKDALEDHIFLLLRIDGAPWQLDSSVPRNLTFHDALGTPLELRSYSAEKVDGDYIFQIYISDAQDLSRITMTYQFGSVCETYILEGVVTK